MKRKILAVILALSMVLPLLPLTGILSFAESGILYYDENGEAQYYTGQLREVTPSTWGEDGQTSWYYVNSALTLDARISIRGNVRLILGNNALITFGDLNIPRPFEVASYNNRSLTIYAQSKDKDTCGKMILNCLGSEGYRGLGTLTINGGNIESVAVQSYMFTDRGVECAADCAGIGLYLTYESESRYAGGSITINGGFIKAVGSNFAAGIGGSFGSSVQTITINGGEIEARGGYGAPGIGTGYKCGTKNEECVININGGNITAIGGDGAPGIGSGFNSGNNLTINVTGGEINATAGVNNNVVLTEKQNKNYKITELESGAGIGAGVLSRGKVNVNITGGTVNASATKGAGIGGAEVVEGQTEVNISGGTVHASATKGAGIGSGYNQRNSSSVTVNVTGGEVTAQSTEAKGIGDGLNTNKTNVLIAGTDVVHHSVLASSYNANTVIDGSYKDSAAVGTARITAPSDAAGVTIRPILYDYEFGNDQGPYVEMTGCERKYLSEFLAQSLLPLLEDQVVYVVNEDLAVDQLWVFGSTILYLCRNATLTVRESIFVVNENMDGVNAKGNLIVVAEAEDSGKLICGPSVKGAAIGSSYDDYKLKTYETGLIRVYSGTVEAYGGAGFSAIGGKNLEFSLYGGVVKAVGGAGAPGIGVFADDATGGAEIGFRGGRVYARGGTSQQPWGVGAQNADIEIGWESLTDAYDVDPFIGSVTISSGKEFKYLGASPVRAAFAEDFLEGGVFVPHTSTYYIDENGERRTVDDYTELTNNGNANTVITTVDGGWYVCVNGAQNPLQLGKITVNGTMNLILTDGTEMRPENILVKPGATLNVWGQYAGTGVLRAFGAESDSGIGGDTFNFTCGDINIYGGKVFANASINSAGIGGAGLSGGGGNISIYGGEVTVTPHADQDGAMLGIGNGWNQSGTAVNFYGGRITAGAVSGTLNFGDYFLYADDGTRVFEDGYDASRTIVPGLPEAAEYIDENGEEKSTYDYKRLNTDSTQITGTYYVYEDLTVTNRLNVTGTATLILKDGVTLTAEKGIGVNEGNTLKIYAHSTKEDVTGALTVPDPGISFAAIGGDGSNSGSGDEAVGSGDVLIAGGRITATGGASAAAIGSGGATAYYPLDGGTVTITGGYITANGQNGPAIGTGSDTVTGTVNISGGVVEANNQGYAAAIGAGNIDSRNVQNVDLTVNISGGTVTAKANGYMSRTNIGYAGSGMTVNVSGGQIDASFSGSFSASGIGFTGNEVNFTAGDPDMYVKYFKVKGTVTFDGGFAYDDGRIASAPLEDGKTIRPVAGNFALVTFDPANGNDTASVYVLHGGTVGEPAAPEKEGHDFVGWFEDGSSDPFDFSDPIDFDTVLTAHYEKKVYTVTFLPENGEDSFTQQVEHGDPAVRPDDPEMLHATFDGWYAEGAEQPFDFDAGITGDLTLTAHYFLESFTVVFHTGDADMTQSEDYGSTVTRPADPEKAGFAFIGWRESGSATLYDFETPLECHLDLYAVWAYMPYTILGGTGGNDDENTDQLLDNNSGTKWCVTSFEYDADYACYIEFSAQDRFVPTGYVMVTANDTHENPDRNPVSWKLFARNSVSEPWTLIETVSNDTTLGATRYTPYVFDFECDNAYRIFRLQIDECGNSSVFQLADFLFTADSFASVPEYTVSFSAGEGTGTVPAITALQGDGVILPDPGQDLTPPDGLQFIGWSLGGVTYGADTLFTVTDNVTLTAEYAEPVTVTFVDGGNTTEAFPFLPGTEITLPGNVFGFTAPEGKVFVGWAYDGSVYLKDDPFIVSETTVFEAVWEDASPWDLLREQLAELGDGDELSLTLTSDLIATSSSEHLYIPEGAVVTIDLAGYKIDRALTASVYEGWVFYVDGTLTVTDSSSAGTGVITGGFNAEDGGEGGGFYVSSLGTLILEGGTVTGNVAFYGGGVETYGVFIMTGGRITGNVASYGGGVEMYGDDAEIVLSGGASIYGNVVTVVDNDSGETVSHTNNIGLYTDQFITVGGAFTGARIGVSTYSDVSEDEPVTFTHGLDGASVSAFFADGDGYTVRPDGNGEACIAVGAGIDGDVNGDGILDIVDVTVLLDVLAGSGAETPACDVNADGTVSITDVTALLDMLAGKN